MGLSLHERRVIADIERSLSQEDPGLAKALADFGRTRPGGRPVEPSLASPARPPAVRPAPPAEAQPPDEDSSRRTRRAVAWSVAVALTLLSAALALSEAGLLVAAGAAALGGVVCWGVSRRERRRGPPGPERGG